MEEKYKAILESIKEYSKQLQQVWDDFSSLSIPEEYQEVENVIFCGMGGSGLGERIMDSLFESETKVPIELFSDYELPGYATKDSLIVVSSYSGNTEEVLNFVREAEGKKLKIFGITTGGKLASYMSEQNIPGYIFNPSHNPSGQPRMAIGYAAGAIMTLLGKLKLLDFGQSQVRQCVAGMEIGFRQSEADKLAAGLKDRVPVLVASEHLIGATHTVKNQFNETAKTFALLFDLPELNHHLMEGLLYPASNTKTLKFLFLESDRYSKQVQKRYPLTASVVRKQDIKYESVRLKAKSDEGQAFELLVFGSLVVYFLAKLYSVDPTKIPWVDYFKKELSK